MKILKPKDVKNGLYHLIGAVLIVLNYIRHGLAGYRTPRTFSIKQLDKAIDYDFKIVNRWLEYIRNYSGEQDPLRGKVVLELGAGADLGAGLLLLAMGVRKYIALDVNNLAVSVSNEFYERLFERMRKNQTYDVDFAKEQLGKFQRGEDSKLCYVVDKEFGNVQKLWHRIFICKLI